MRRKDHEISDRREMESVLKKAGVCRLGCADNGRPYIVPLSFGYSGGSIFIHSAPEGQKISILKKNPDCCIEVDEFKAVIRGEKPCRSGMRYRSVICQGKAYFINDPDEKRKGLKLYPGPLWCRSVHIFRRRTTGCLCYQDRDL